MPKIRILIADDHPAVQEKVAALLETTCEIVASATNGQEALESAIRDRPDIILMDISMPILNGIKAAQCLIKMKTAAKIVFLTVHEDPDFVRAALATGASGYVIKSHMATDLLPAIKKALAGHRYVSPYLLTERSHSFR